MGRGHANPSKDSSNMAEATVTILCSCSGWPTASSQVVGKGVRGSVGNREGTLFREDVPCRFSLLQLIWVAAGPPGQELRRQNLACATTA